MMDIPVLGIAENMSYLSCPDCGKKIQLFGESNIAQTCSNYKVPLIGKFPLDPQLTQLGDAGRIEEYDGEVYSAISLVCHLNSPNFKLATIAVRSGRP